jgi:tetratricopeptide (TPR) repeat protein
LDSGRRAYNDRKYGEAVTHFERAAGNCSPVQPVLLQLAQAQLMAQQLPASLATLEKLLAASPRNADATKLRGDVLYLLGRQADAEESLQSSLSIDPGHDGARYALARIFYQQNRFPEAIELFRELIARDPANYRAHDNLALCYAALQQDSDALKHFLRALDLVHKNHPEYDTAYANAANFFLDRGEFQKAFQLGAEAAKRNPNYARNFFLTGKALVRLDKHELSVRWLRQAIDLDPNYKEAHYWLATVYRKLGKTEEAARELAVFRELSKTPDVRR